MKKTLLSAAFLFAAMITASAQTTTAVSFETSEGFTLGTVNGQNDWQVANNVSLPENFMVVNTLASDGSNSLRLNTGLTGSSTNTTLRGVYSQVFGQMEAQATISQDIYVDEFDTQAGSDIYVDFFELDGTTIYLTARVILAYNGNIHAINGVSGTSFTYGENLGTYSAGWNNVTATLDVNADEVKIYVNNTLIVTTPIINGAYLDVSGYRFDDYSTGFNVDNISHIDGAIQLSTPNQALASFSVFPNPTVDVINVSNANVIDSVSLTDINGRVVKNVVLGATEGQINVSDLSAGVYMVKATSNGASTVTKIVKN